MKVSQEKKINAGKTIPHDRPAEPYEEPQPILDPSCGFEEMDRGEGMAVDDEKTYHRTEK